MDHPGKWSLSQDIRDSIEGRLEINDEGQITLILNGNFGKPIEHLFDLSIHDFIYGITYKGKYIIVKNGYEVINEGGMEITINGEYCLIFDSVASKDMKYSCYSVSFDRLGSWISKNNIAVNKLGDTNAVSIIASPSILWEGKFGNYGLSFLHNINIICNRYDKIQIDSNYICKYMLDEPVHLNDFSLDLYIKSIEQIRILLSVLIGDDIYVNNIQFNNDSGGIADLYFYGLSSSCEKSIKNYTQTLPFPQIEVIFSELLSQWIEKYDNLEGTSRIITQYLMDMGRKKRMIDIPTIIKDVCVGVEAYSRNIRNEKIEENEEVYKARYDKILSSVGDEEKAWLKIKLKYSNEATLRKRLNLLLNELAEKYSNMESIMGLTGKKEISILVGRIVDTRNFYTHYDLESAGNIFEDEKAYNISRIMLEVLRVLTMQEIGIPQQVINHFIGNNQQFLQACERMGFVEIAPTYTIKVIPISHENKTDEECNSGGEEITTQ